MLWSLSMVGWENKSNLLTQMMSFAYINTGHLVKGVLGRAARDSFSTFLPRIMSHVSQKGLIAKSYHRVNN